MLFTVAPLDLAIQAPRKVEGILKRSVLAQETCDFSTRIDENMPQTHEKQGRQTHI
jgi:hypothetical protein